MENTGAGSSTLLQTRFFSGAIPQTPGNIEQVTEIEELISRFQNQTLDSPKLTLLHKTFKAARLAMADRVVLNRTNTELLAANTRKKRQVQRTGILYDGQGARILSLEDVEERRQQAEIKRNDKEAKKLAQKEKQDDQYFLQVSKTFMRLEPDLIYRSNPPISSKNTKTSGTSARNKKREDQALINAFQDLLQIDPDLFKELDLNDLVSNTTIQNKGKAVFRKKNITELVQVGLGVVEEEKEEEILETWISSQGRIIRNTRKM